MATERWDKIQRIYHSALEQEISHRRAFISQACAGDKSLEQEIISLVEQEGTTSFLEEPALEVAAKVLASPEPGACSHPTAIGRYRIIRMLGEGGMGTVYEAEQDEPHRIVALKVIKLGMAGADRVRRFRQERQILAGLAHPGIARLLDGDYTESGAPYLVMEYVDGQPITQWCDERNLNLPARLRLFQKLCDAVEFAHRHLVVHRDLKPANVLVTPEGEPKLLDFGIAKLIDQNADATWTVERALTLDYTSPEQVRGGPITTAADVYALGILLYELIAAKRLYTFSTSPLEEAIDSICTRDPAPPSAIASKPLSEDLDAIVLKAMRKEAQERYPSPRALSDDIERFLTSRPVLARLGTLRYVASKFVRRHRAAVAVAAVLLLTLSGATASIAWEAHIARLERDRAQRRFNDVRGLARAVIFDLQNKLSALPGTTEVRKDMVALAINYLDASAKEGSDDPGLLGELAAAYINVGDIQGNLNTHNLGDLPAAMNSYAKAEPLARTLVARYSSRRAKMLLASVLIKQAYGAKFANDSTTGARKAMEALQVVRENAQYDPANPDVQFQLGTALQCAAAFGDSKESLPYLLEEATLFEGLLARNPDNLNRRRNTALAHKYIAGTLNDIGNPDAAFEHLKRAEELDEACVRTAPNDPEHKMDLAIDMSQWGEYYESKKDLATAVQYTRAALAIRRGIVSADPKDSRAKDRLAYILNRLGDLQLNMSARQALASYQEAKSIGERLPPTARSLPLAKAFLGIAGSYGKLGDMEHSCAAYAESTKLYREVVKQSPRYSEPAEEAKKGNARCTSANR
jgi:eukaryotic-like serine/threonine-protein kinase